MSSVKRASYNLHNFIAPLFQLERRESDNGVAVWVYMSKEELKRERREVDILANIS